MKLELYYTPYACSLVPYVTLAEVGADFEVRPINIRKSQHLSPEYLKVNPKHKIPTLVIEGEPLTENVAIEVWIAKRFPNAKLLPTDQIQEAKAISLMAWCAAGIHPALSIMARPQRYCDFPGAEDSVRRCAEKLLLESFQVADDMLAGREWFFDHFTAPDIYFYWCYRRAKQLKADLSAFQNCNAHSERMQNRPSVQKLLAYEARILEEFAKEG